MKNKMNAIVEYTTIINSISGRIIIPVTRRVKGYVTRRVKGYPRKQQTVY